MTPLQLLRILGAHKRWIAACVVGALALSALALLVIPKKYRASASVVVNGRAADPLYTAQAQQGGPSIATQIDIIKRPRIARQVVKDLGIDKDASARTQWQESGTTDDFETWLAQGIGGGLFVAPTAESNVIEIQYVSRDAKDAARFANAFAKAYVATSLELRTNPARQFVTFFDERLAELRKQVEASQARLSAFEKQTGLINAPDKSDMENARLAELSSQLALAQSSQADAISRQRGLKGNASASPEIMQNPVIQQLKTNVSSQQVKVRELSLRLGPNHPQLQRAQGELNEMQARLNAEIGQVATSVGTSERVSSAKVAELRQAIDTQRNRVLSLQGQRDQADVLQKEVANAQRAYDTVMQRQSQTMLESQAQTGDVSILDSAYPPNRATSPNGPLILTLGLVAGLLLGLLVAFVREYLSPLVRGAEDLSYLTGVPVLVVLPPAHGLGGRRTLGSRMRNPRALPA